MSEEGAHGSKPRRHRRKAIPTVRTPAGVPLRRAPRPIRFPSSLAVMPPCAELFYTPSSSLSVKQPHKRLGAVARVCDARSPAISGHVLPGRQPGTPRCRRRRRPGADRRRARASSDAGRAAARARARGWSGQPPIPGSSRPASLAPIPRKLDRTQAREEAGT